MRYLIYILPIFVLTLCAGCKTYVPVETIKVDSVRVVQIERDSVHVLDSVIVQTIADTVYKTKYRYIYKDALRTDTMWRVRIDTLTRVVEIERKLTRYEQMKMDAGGAAMWILGALIIATVIWLIRKFKGI